MNVFNPTLYAGTPTVTVMDNRGLSVRDIAYHRTTAGEQADTRITRHQYSPHNFLIESIDPRLFDLQSQSTIKPNFTYCPALKGDVLRTESVDAGQTVILSDIEGRPLLNISAMGVVKHWQYEESTLSGRLLAVSERKSEASTPQIIERFIWAENSQSEKDHNLAGKYLRHYDTAGLNQLNAVSLTGVDLSQSRQLLQDLVYHYDPVGNLLNIRNNAEVTRFWCNQIVEPENHYAYDTLYQLVSASGREIASIGQQGSRLPVLIIPLPANDDVYTR
ncbi:RHS repeat protein [Xenorhabdus bovienii]|uniref:Uncharacterized protein n=1 Tax=Xenorhabdus bovienii str. feltiae Moldova TaxID=1398200 RepID=A0A077NXA6_XENBV|nr:RHS repeat protein [Xenorhabdus bovienii]CDH03144.1 hypothetical protein XBFM1_550041 [Xenorhabdus bovienii str. feltiae Moldova]